MSFGGRQKCNSWRGYFEVLLKSNLWAKNANSSPILLEEKLAKIEFVKITQKARSNIIFALLPKEIITHLQEKFHFYIWDKTSLEA